MKIGWEARPTPGRKRRPGRSRQKRMGASMSGVTKSQVMDSRVRRHGLILYALSKGQDAISLLNIFGYGRMPGHGADERDAFFLDGLGHAELH